jgi:ADP-ribose diphosphatase
MIRPWPLLASKQVFDAELFQIVRDRARSPRTGVAHDFHVVSMADWLMVVALTKEGKLVLVRQYRHGAREVGLEVPGGLHDGDGEEMAKGAARELMEETGYGGGTWTLLGELRPQPALLSNRVWIYLATELELMGKPRPDSSEDIDVVLLAPEEIPACIASPQMNNAITVAALALAQFGGHLEGMGHDRSKLDEEQPADDSERHAGFGRKAVDQRKKSTCPAGGG